MIAGGLFALFCIATIIQCFYILFDLSFLSMQKVSESSVSMPPVSVIISARNESKNLRLFLPDILEQSYPEFQVIVVNDCSWDDSAQYLEEMADAYRNLKIVTLKEQAKYPHGKKLALTLGIKGAAYEHLLFTDADCKPASKFWLKEMAGNFVKGKELVIGYGGYTKTPGILNKWIRLDTVYNAILFLNRALKGKAYMGVGRNLAYSKTLFFNNKGFAGHYHIMSGDDDLLVNETATSTNTAVEISPQSFTYSTPSNSWSSWLHQKKRHMSTGPLYDQSDKLYLGTFFFSLALFYLTAIILVVMKHYAIEVVTMVIFRLAIQLVVFGKGMQKLKESDIIWLMPIFEFIMVLTYPFITASNLIVKTKTWK